MVENKRTKILWNFKFYRGLNLKTNNQVMINQLEVVLADQKQKRGIVIDKAITGDMTFFFIYIHFFFTINFTLKLWNSIAETDY